MSPTLISCLVGLLGIAEASARIGQTPAELEAEYGRPVKRANDDLGSKRYYYQRTDYRIEVNVIDGRSEYEMYRRTDSPWSPAEIESFLALNSLGKRWTKNGPRNWILGQSPPEAFAIEVDDSSEPYLAISTRKWDELGLTFSTNRTMKEQTFVGTAHLKKQEGTLWAVIKSGEAVVEFGIGLPTMPNRIRMEEGKTYSVTVIDEHEDDMATQLAVISDIEHHTWKDCVDDATLSPLVQVRADEKVVYDRSVCERHHIKMELRTVDIDYGMIVLDPCAIQFPHYRDFALGGCMAGEKKSCPLYICSRCVADFETCQRGHHKPRP